MKLNSGYNLAFILGVISLFLTVGQLRAATDTFTYTGASGVNNNWSNGANWAGGVAPDPSGTDGAGNSEDIVLSAAATTSNVDQPYTVNSITQASGAAYTLSASTSGDTISTGSFTNNSTSDLNVAVDVTSSGAVNVNNGVIRFTGSVFALFNISVATTATAYLDGATTSEYGQYYASASGTPTPNALFGGIGTLQFGLTGNGVNLLG